MKFQKVSKQQVWDQVQESTQQVLQGECFAGLLAWLRTQGVEPERSVFPEIGEVEPNVYSGTVISQQRAVLEFYVDCQHPEDAELDDVSDALGPKDPHHPQADLHNPITMGLVFFDNR